MKKSLIGIITVITVLCSTALVSAQQQPTVKVGSERYNCIISDSHTFIPMRNVFEALGYTVDWIAEDKAVTLTKDEMELSLYTQTSTVTGYGVLKNKVIIVNERTYLPFRELLNMLGYDVTWDADTKTAVVVLPEAESTTESTKEVTTQTTTEATTETTTTITYDNDIYVGGEKVNNSQELINSILENIKNQPKPTADELAAMVSVDKEEGE